MKLSNSVSENLQNLFTTALSPLDNPNNLTEEQKDRLAQLQAAALVSVDLLASFLRSITVDEAKVGALFSAEFLTSEVQPAIEQAVKGALRKESRRNQAVNGLMFAIRTFTLYDGTASRQSRFEGAIAKVDEAMSDIETLREEIEEWRDNLPENLQNSDLYSRLDTCVDALQTVYDEIDNAKDCETPEFPSMFGG